MKATIVFEDIEGPDGEIQFGIVFDPPLEVNSEGTAAQFAAIECYKLVEAYLTDNSK